MGIRTTTPAGGGAPLLAGAATGRWVAPGAANSSSSQPANTFVGVLLGLAAAVKIDTLQIEVATAGIGVGQVGRLGVYSIDVVTGAALLVVDGGTVDVTAAGVKTLTVPTTTLPAGMIALGAATQGTQTTGASYRSARPGPFVLAAASALSSFATTDLGIVVGAGVAGALPTMLTVEPMTGFQPPRVAVRLAA